MKKQSSSPAPWVRSLLSKKTLSSLHPELASEVVLLLSKSCPDKTLSSRTKLSALYDLWLCHRNSLDSRSIKKSEEIMVLMGKVLHFDAVQRQLAEGPQESRRKPMVSRARRENPSEMQARPPLHQKLAILGITDERTIEKLERSADRGTLEARATTLLKTFEGIEDVAKEVVPKQIKLFILPHKEFKDNAHRLRTTRETLARIREKAIQYGHKSPPDIEREPEHYLDPHFHYNLFMEISGLQVKKMGVLPWLTK